MAAILTLSEFKTAKGVDPTNTSNDTKYQFALDAANLAILNYTDRDFGSTSAIETRSYEYDGSGFLDIDDASIVTAVVIRDRVSGLETPVDSNWWEAQPYNGPVYEYIVLPKSNYFSSPAMGFERNLDRYYAENPYFLPSLIKVTGTYGWPTVPADVKQAAFWTVESLLTQPTEATSESIAGYSHSFSPQGPMLAIPNRARDLLVVYQRQKV